MDNDENLRLAQRYIAAVERGAVGDELAAFYAPDAIQEELPNRLNPRGSRRDLNAILDGAVRGQQLMSAQRYEILNAVARGTQVALEIRWTGTLAVAVGSLAAGAQMKAQFAVFLEIEQGRIVRQRNYDCFEPW